MTRRTRNGLVTLALCGVLATGVGVVYDPPVIETTGVLDTDDAGAVRTFRYSCRIPRDVPYGRGGRAAVGRYKTTRSAAILSACNAAVGNPRYSVQWHPWDGSLVLYKGRSEVATFMPIVQPSGTRG